MIKSLQYNRRRVTGIRSAIPTRSRFSRGRHLIVISGPRSTPPGVCYPVPRLPNSRPISIAIWRLTKYRKVFPTHLTPLTCLPDHPTSGMSQQDATPAVPELATGPISDLLHAAAPAPITTASIDLVPADTPVQQPNKPKSLSSLPFSGAHVAVQLPNPLTPGCGRGFLSYAKASLISPAGPNSCFLAALGLSMCMALATKDPPSAQILCEFFLQDPGTPSDFKSRLAGSQHLVGPDLQYIANRLSLTLLFFEDRVSHVEVTVIRQVHYKPCPAFTLSPALSCPSTFGSVAPENMLVPLWYNKATLHCELLVNASQRKHLGALLRPAILRCTPWPLAPFSLDLLLPPTGSHIGTFPTVGSSPGQERILSCPSPIVVACPSDVSLPFTTISPGTLSRQVIPVPNTPEHPVLDVLTASLAHPYQVLPGCKYSSL